MASSENRIYKREQFLGTVDLTDGLRVCATDTVNISVSGIALDRVPEALIKNIKNGHTSFTGVVNKGTFTAKVSLRPIWYKKIDAMYYMVGFEVKKVAGSWFAFIKDTTKLVKDPVNDVWGSTDKYFSR